MLTKEAIEKVISRSEEVLDGRHLLIKNGKDFTGRPAEKKQRYHVESTNDVPTVASKIAGEQSSISTEDNQVARIRESPKTILIESKERKTNKRHSKPGKSK